MRAQARDPEIPFAVKLSANTCKACSRDISLLFVKVRSPNFALVCVSLVGLTGVALWLVGHREESILQGGDPSEKRELTDQVVEHAAEGNGAVEEIVQRRSSEGDGGMLEVPDAVDIKSVEPLSLEDNHSHTLGLWLGVLDPHPANWDRQSVNDSESLRIRMKLPDGELHDLRFEQFEEIGSGKGSYVGLIEGRDNSHAIFTFVNDAVVASLRLPSSHVAWEIRNQADGVQLFEKVDLMRMKSCKLCSHE